MIGGLYDWGIELVATSSGARTISEVLLFGVVPMGSPVLPAILAFFEGGILVLAAFELTRGVLDGGRRSLRVGMSLVLGLCALISLESLLRSRLPDVVAANADAATLTVRALFAPRSLALLAVSGGATLVYISIAERRDPGARKGLLAWYLSILFAAGVWYTPVFLAGTRQIAVLIGGAFEPAGIAEQIAVLFGFSLLVEAAGFYLPVYGILRSLGPFERR
ncbi:hypothetical protein MYXO_01165 [Myxococcaceae bacterium]|nr:hypothetical protein MYXO_01165 [Myxococcaceae bacterium]